ncbi:12768_t:CDS:10 [Entrophospora sp. SA101]|nr:12768_t:CDS:10 [Entrophospora sp. SA101]
MKVKIKRWNSVAYWRWDVSNEEVCGICRNLFDGCCPTCRIPGDDCPLICGECTHVFHMHCLLKWLQTEGSRGMCPMDRGTWGNPPSPVDHIIYDDLQEIRIIKNDPNSIVNDQSDGIDKDGNEDYIEEYVGEEYEKGGNSGDNKSYVIERIEEGELKTQQDVGVVGSCGGFDEEAQSEQTFRKRKTKNYYEKPKVIKDLEWLKFREWLNQQGFPKTKLTLAEFKDLLENQRKKFIDDFKVVNKFLEKNADLSMPITYDEFLWGWLNEFNKFNKSYEITTYDSIKKGQQVFINYGPHDNYFLLIEYGEVFEIELEEQEKIMKHETLKNEGFLGDYTIHKSYASFRLLNSLRLLFSKNNSEIQEWKQVIRGNREIINENNERLINDWLEKICNRKIQEINQILNDIDKSEKEKTQMKHLIKNIKSIWLEIINILNSIQ